MTTKDFAALMEVHVRTVRKWINLGKVRAKRKTDRGPLEIDRSERERILVDYTPRHKKPRAVQEPEAVDAPPEAFHEEQPPAYTAEPIYSTLCSRWGAAEDAWKTLGELPEGENPSAWMMRKFRECFGRTDEAV